MKKPHQVTIAKLFPMPIRTPPYELFEREFGSPKAAAYRACFVANTTCCGLEYSYRGVTATVLPGDNPEYVYQEWFENRGIVP